jgi:hypothetical protein
MRRRSMNLIRGDSARGGKLTISSSGVWGGDEDIFLNWLRLVGFECVRVGLQDGLVLSWLACT